MSKPARYLIFGLLLISGIFIAWQIKTRQNVGAEATYQTYTLARGTLTAQVGATGAVRAAQTAELIWQTSGRVSAVYVQAGEYVQEGTLLAELAADSIAQSIILAQTDLVNARRALEDLQQSGLARAQAQLNLIEAQKALEEAQRKAEAVNYPRASQDLIDSTRAQLDLAEANLTRAEEIYRMYADRPDGDEKKAQALLNLTNARQERDRLRGLLSWYEGDYDDLDVAERQARLALAEAQYADALREWERLKDGPTAEDLAAAQARIDAAQAMLNLARLQAPFSGVVTIVSTQPGDLVTAGSFAFRLDDLRQLLVDVSIPEVDINSVTIGQPVTLTFDAVPDQTYHGQVIEVGQVGLVQQGITNFNVVIALQDADERVRPGMTAAVNILVREINDALLIPNRAVRLLDGQRVVYKLYPDGTIEPIEIRLGASAEGMSVLLGDALAAGDEIVLNPPSPTNPLFGH